MKTLITTFLILSILSSSAWAQDTLDSSFSTSSTSATTGLTDEQAAAAQAFVHQGVKDAAIKKGCAELSNCDESAVDSKGAVLPAMIENNIGKLYTVLFGGLSFLSGGGPKVNVKPKADAKIDEKTGKPTKETKSDFCMYGAMGYEVIAMGMQTAMNQNTTTETSSIKDPQLAALVSLKKTHLARKKTATYQSAVYGATFACYAARALLSGGTISMDAKYIAKMTAAAGIALLYKMKADKHKKAAALVQKVIDSLPKAGDCNPWTGTACFCKETTSITLYPSEYESVCVLKVTDETDPTVASGCATTATDGTVSYDSSCACKTTNTCYMATVATYNPNFNLGANLMNDANKAYSALSSGTLSEGSLGAISDKANAIATKMNPKIDTSKVPQPVLTVDQKPYAASLGTVMPQSLANAAAAGAISNPTGGLTNSMGAALEKLPTSIKEKLDPEVSGKYSTKGGGQTVAGAEEPGFTLPKLPGSEEEATNGTEIVSFAEKAINNADVSNSPDTPIFDIISNRYRRSALKLFPQDH
jgi:hypothetical protein